MTDNFTEWIETETRNKGWTFSELARRSELSTGTISDVISGRAKPGVQFCSGIARALGTPPERVFRMAGLLPPLIIGNGREDEDELLSYYRSLRTDNQHTLKVLARTLYERQLEYEVDSNE